MDVGVESATWRTIGTHADLVVNHGELAAARAAAEAVLDEVDRTYSRFLPASELVALNNRAGETVALSPLLARVIDESLRVARLTEGLCDPTVGRALSRLGYDADFALVEARAEPIVLRMERVPGWQALRFDPLSRTLWAPRGVELDLGSIGKAFAADLAAPMALAAAGSGGVLLSLGGDLSTAGEPPTGGWRVLAAEDSSTPPESGGEVIAIQTGSIATSSSTIRRWRAGNLDVHHIIDPRTGLPASSPWRTVSVIAGSCVDANAAATAALVRGSSGPAWVASLGLSGRFIGHDGDAVRVGGWPDPR